MRRTVPTAKRPRATVTRVDGRVVKKLTVYMPADLAKRLHIRCIEDDTNMSDVIVGLVDDYLGKRQPER